MSKGFRNVFSLFLIALSMSVSAKAAVLRELQPLHFQWPHSGWLCHAANQEGGAAPWRTAPRFHKNPDDAYNSTIEGRVALISAVFPIVSLAAFSLTSFPFFLVPVFVFAIIAVIFGSVGMRRRKRGFAIAGFIVGMLSIVAGFAALVAL